MAEDPQTLAARKRKERTVFLALGVGGTAFALAAMAKFAWDARAAQARPKEAWES